MKKIDYNNYVGKEHLYTIITKKGMWYKHNTIVQFETWMYHTSGLFRGTYIVGSCNPKGYDIFWSNQGYKNGDEVEMGEICSYEEFKWRLKK